METPGSLLDLASSASQGGAGAAALAGDWFASGTMKTLLKYSNFGDDRGGSEGDSSLHFSLNRLSFKTSDSIPSGEQSPSDSLGGLGRGTQKMTVRVTKADMRERSRNYSQKLRKEKKQSHPKLPLPLARDPGYKGQDLLNSSHTSLPRVPSIASDSASKGGRNSNRESYDFETDVTAGLDSLSESELGLSDFKGLSSKSVLSAEDKKREVARKMSQMNRLVPNTNAMHGVIPSSRESSVVWSVDSPENAIERSTFLKNVTTPPQSSLDPWLENEAKRENEAMVSEMEDELRYKIRNLAVEYDRLQFRALESEEVITTQTATINLKNKMHKKELMQREKLLAREAVIKDRIKQQDEDRMVIVARRMTFNHMLQRVAKLHVETYKRVQVEEKKVVEISEECEVAKKKQIKIKTAVNAAKIEKFKWLGRHEEEQKRKRTMIEFRRGELAKLRKQSKKLGLVTDSQVISGQFLSLIQTVQGAGIEADNVENSVVDKTTSTMIKLHKLYNVTDTSDAEGVIEAWKRSKEGLEALGNEVDKTEAKLGSLHTDKVTLQEDLELLQLTGRGIFMEKSEEVRHITLQAKLDTDLKELSTKTKVLTKVKNELLVMYQGILNMLKKMKVHGPPELGVLNENLLGSLKHQINLEYAGSVPEDIDPHDVITLFKHFEECLINLNKSMNAKSNHSINFAL